MARYHFRPGQRRPGKVLVFFALLLPVLIGMLGLVIDSGLLLAAHRQSHNAADAGALAAAMDLLRNKGITVATQSATTYVQSYNGLAGSAVTVNALRICNSNVRVSATRRPSWTPTAVTSTRC